MSARDEKPGVRDQASSPGESFTPQSLSLTPACDTPIQKQQAKVHNGHDSDSMICMWDVGGGGTDVRRVKPKQMSQGRSERACRYGLSSGPKKGGLAPECQVWCEADLGWSLPMEG